MNCNDAEFVANPRLTGLDPKEKYGKPAPYFRTEFTLDGKIKKATLYASALGVFKAYINGREVDDDVMSPGYTDYRRRIPYMTYDVTALLEKENALGFICGDGWAVGYMGNYMFRCNYAEAVHIWAKLHVEFEDGSCRDVNSSEEWKTTDRGEIVRTDNYMGEVVDHRRSLDGFSRFGYDDSDWDTACTTNHSNAAVHLLDPAIAPASRVKHVLEGREIARTQGENGEVCRLYDFGQNFAGVARIVCKGAGGESMTVRYGEWLNDDGSLYTDNLRKAEATDIFILAGDGQETFCPKFTFHGFRYAEIRATAEIGILSVEGLSVYTDLKETGKFGCSDPLVNRLYENTVWGQRSNFLSVPTDCPQRDERLGWMGDAQIFCGSAMFNMDCRAFFRKYIADILDAQLGNGSVPSIVPQIPHKDSSIEMGWWTPAGGWSEAIVIIPYEYYKMYGDMEILRSTVYACKRFIDFMAATSDGWLRLGDIQFGDWLAIDEYPDRGVIVSLYFAYATALLVKICELLGDGDAERYFALYEKIRDAFRARYVAADGKIESDTQTCYLLAYEAGVLDKEIAKKHLLRTLARRNNHLATGFLGVKLLLPVLCEMDETALAYEILTQRDYPSWLYSVVNGATTVWERWNSYTKENGFADKTMNSFNHYSLGSCCEWMYKYCAGIFPEATREGAGFKRTHFSPFPDPSGRITSARAEYDSVCGKITAEWEKSGKGFVYRVEYSEKTEAVFDFARFAVAEQTGNKEFYLEYGADGKFAADAQRKGSEEKRPEEKRPEEKNGRKAV